MEQHEIRYSLNIGLKIECHPIHNITFFSPPQHEEGLGLQGDGLTAPNHHQLCFLTFFRIFSECKSSRMTIDHPDYSGHPNQPHWPTTLSTLITPSNHSTTSTFNINVQNKQKIVARSKLQILPRTTISKHFVWNNNFPKKIIQNNYLQNIVWNKNLQDLRKIRYLEWHFTRKSCL